MDVWRAAPIEQDEMGNPIVDPEDGQDDTYFIVSGPVAVQKRLHSITTDKRDSLDTQSRGAWRNPLLLLTKPIHVEPGDRVEVREGEGLQGILSWAPHTCRGWEVKSSVGRLGQKVWFGP